MNINDIALKVLSWTKIIKGDAVDLDGLKASDIPIVNHDNWTALLQKHVTLSGDVNYKGFIQDGLLLQEYLDDLSKQAPGSNWTEKEQLAYWINAYNAFTVKLILDHYPLKSIKDITEGSTLFNSPWDMKFFKIGNIDFDLGTIEHEILRKKYNEPRIHFAINCASFSCPKLRNEAFTAAKLEEQLEEQAIGFVNNLSKNVINEKQTKLSKIFDWFKSDFIKKSNLTEYLMKYAPSLNTSNKVEYIEYDWSLNDFKL